LSITGAITFKVGFGSNCATVLTGGEVTIHTGKEKYTMTKCVPDMMVNNVIWGDKYLMWSGAVTITCSDNNFVANIRLSEESGRNLINGEILEGETNLYRLHGLAGQKAYIVDLSKQQPVGEGLEEGELFVDISNYKDNTIFHIPNEVQSPFSSLKLWRPVKEAIIKNDMAVADEEKKKIEADQRIRQRTRLETGAWKDAQYFHFSNKNPEEGLTEEEEVQRGTWEFKDNFTIDQDYTSSITREAEEIRAKIEAERALAEEEEEENSEPEEQDGACSVQ